MVDNTREMKKVLEWSSTVDFDGGSVLTKFENKDSYFTKVDEEEYLQPFLMDGPQNIKDNIRAFCENKIYEPLEKIIYISIIKNRNGLLNNAMSMSDTGGQSDLPEFIYTF